jgi:hypothetical protein
LLHFTLAEFLEFAKHEFTEITALFEDLISRLGEEHEKVNSKYDKERADLLATMAPVVSAKEQDEWDGERREKEREAARQREKKVDEQVEGRRKRDLKALRDSITLSWIVYMRTARRAQVRNQVLRDLVRHS